MNPFLRFAVAFCVVVAMFSHSVVDLALRAGWRMWVYPLGVTLLFVFSVMRLRARSAQCECESCGRRFFWTRKGEQSGSCPACRNAKLPPERHRRLAFQGFVIIIILLLMLTFVLAYPLQAHLGGIAYPLIAIGLFLILCGGFALRCLVRGADALIDLLGKDDQIPAKEIVWSLESISGLALGNDVRKWTDWFDHLPSDATGVYPARRT
jgi:hypothetical protein